MISKYCEKVSIMYEIISLSSKYRYYGIIEDINRDEWIEAYNTSRKLRSRQCIVDKLIKPRTIDRLEQYIDTCQPLYRDLIIKGIKNFKVIFIRCCEYRYIDSLFYELDWYTNYYKKSYNKIGELEHKKNITGIKCIETGIVYPTPGKAAKAVGLKDKSSIIKVLNEPFRTAAKYHWIRL